MSDQSEIERLVGTFRLTTSPELDQRVLRDAAANQARAVDVIRPPASSGASSRWKGIVPSAAAAAVLLLAGLWWISRPDDLWAQVVRKVQSKPWILMQGKTPDGEVKMWISIPEQTTAVKSPDHISLTRFKDAVAESWDSESKQVVRRAVTQQSGERLGFEAFSTLFERLFGGKEDLEIGTAFGRLPGMGTIRQSRVAVRDDDGTWYDYRITVQQERGESDSMTMRVNAQTLLPSRMTVANANQPAVTFSIEYPEHGPTDIYVLGVPRDAEIVDATPQALEGPQKEIVSQMRVAAEKFGDYRAIIVSSNPDDPWQVGSPVIVWKKGLFSRIDGGFVDPTRPPTRPDPAAQVDRRQWWRARCRELWFRPQEYCDGKSIFQNQFVPTGVDLSSLKTHPRTAAQRIWGKVDWKLFGPVEANWPARTAPVLWAYPDLSGYFTNADLYNVQITSERQGDDRRMQVVKVTFASGDTEWEDEYVLDPSRNHAVVRSSTVAFKIENGERVIQSRTSAVNEDFQRTPSGIWYPTSITNEQFFRQGDNVIEGAAVSRYDLEFEVGLPDALFAAPASSRIGIPE